jgi:hypothetical protein
MAFWRTDDDSANPDTEIINALRPSLATTGGLLLALSSPYARRGELWKQHRLHFGKDHDPILVWQAPTQVMNPAIPSDIIERAEAEDEAAAAAEYGGEFRSDIAAFIPREAIDAVVAPGRVDLPRVARVEYRCFLDFAGGSGGDSATLAVAHTEHRDDVQIEVLDAIREIRPPFSPESACREFADVMTTYGIGRATSDKWGGQFPIEHMAKLGITVEPSAKPKSDLYRELLPLVNSRRVELPDVPRLTNQLASLERRTARGGRDSIDHAPGAHDDLANAAAGALVSSTESGPRFRVMGDSDDFDEAIPAWSGHLLGRW